MKPTLWSRFEDFLDKVDDAAILAILLVALFVFIIIIGQTFKVLVTLLWSLA